MFAWAQEEITGGLASILIETMPVWGVLVAISSPPTRKRRRTTAAHHAPRGFPYFGIGSGRRWPSGRERRAAQSGREVRMKNNIAQRHRMAQRRLGWLGFLGGALAPVGLAMLMIAPAGPALSGPADQATPSSRPGTLDLSAPLSFASGECRFSPAIDRAFPDILYWDEAGQRFATRTVRIGDMSLTPTLAAGPPEGGGRMHRSSVRLTRQARWNGLTLVGLGASAGFEYRRRELRFAEPVAVLRSRLRALGTVLPAPPAWRSIPTDGCAASIGVEVRGRGSALVCTGWC
jgi:hypothetical protein